MTLYKKELRSKADKIKKALTTFNIEASYNDESFRDYLVMIAISAYGAQAGKISIYYKPSKNTFSLKKQIKNTDVEKQVDDVWDQLNGSLVYDAQSGIYEAFVDGSYISGVTGYGAVVYLGDELKATILGTIPDVEFRQFGGELKSVLETLKWCQNNDVSKVRINYDYHGIEKFATGEWKAKNDLSKEYVEFIKNINIVIEWRHIKSHTGNAKNDEADALAKKAATESSSTTSRRFIELEEKALAFIGFINSKKDFSANYIGAENGEYVMIRVENNESGHSGITDIVYAKGSKITIKQQKSAIESDIYNFWQEFLFFEDFNI